MEIDLSLDLSFLDQTTLAPQSLVRPPSDSDVATTNSIVSHFLSLDLLSLSTSSKDAFCIALAMLASASKMPHFKVFISEALAQSFFVFLALYRSLKSNMEISSKLDALKGQKIEFEQAQLAKKQATQRLSKLGTEYDAHKERIIVLAEELENEKAKFTALVEQGNAIKAQGLEHLQRAKSLG